MNELEKNLYEALYAISADSDIAKAESYIRKCLTLIEQIRKGKEQ